MVAESNQHYEPGVLQQLLDDDLSSDDAQRVEDHLSSCTDCRAELEQIAGEDSWWNETVSVLSESTLGKPAESRSVESASIDPSIDWILPLLDNADEGHLGSIDRYTVDEVIGQGGMGVVLRGTDPELNRPVAIKILSPHLAGVGAARARFMREAQAAASIVHPSIVPIYGVITSARLPYIVMPYIRGGNLQQRIDVEGPLELSDVLRIGLQIAEGLTAAHRNGVIHRDIKPSNILVEEGNGRVLISDFGLARALDDATLTNSGMIAGTPPYMSPEQARGDLIDARSDLFSLGSLLYALSTGRPPFRAETPLGVLRKVTETSPKPITQVNEKMPSWIDQLIGRFMEIDVDRRIESAESATELLRSAHAHVVNPSINALPKPLNQVRVRRHAWMLAMTAVVAAVLIAVATLRNEAESNQPGGPVRTTPNPPLSPQSITSPSPPMVGDEWMASEIDNELKNIRSTIDNLSSEMNLPSAN